jgi:DNA-binding IclR family transcriptional regulator
VGAVINAIRVLRHLAQSPTPKGATELARAVGMYPGTCYQVLRTLVGDHLVTFDPETKAYAIADGLGVLAEPRAAGASPTSRRAAMEQLSDRLRATVYLIARTADDKGILLDFVHPEAHHRFPIILSWDSLYVGAIGRLAVALLAQPAEADLQAIFERMPWGRKPAFADWRSDVQEVRRRGYAVDGGHVNPGITTVATPMFSLTGDLTYFLVAIYQESPFDPARARAAARPLRLAAEQIRHELVMQSLRDVSPI